jgi:hypothetical protein
MQHARERLDKNIIKSLAPLTALLAATALTLVYAPPAQAADPFYACHAAQHCYSIALASNNYYGVEANFNDNALTLPSSEIDAGSHVSNEVWLLTRLVSPVMWVETGVARGCNKIVGPGQTCSGINGSSKYMKFWAEADTNGLFYFHPYDQSTSHDGANHTFQIWNSSGGNNNNYGVWLGTNGSFNFIADATHQTHPSGSYLESGMELLSTAGINTNESSESFTNTVHVYRVGQTSWDQSILDGGTVHDVSKCDLTVNCAMDPCSEFAQGKCLSWSLNTPNVWIDQKP